MNDNFDFEDFEGQAVDDSEEFFDSFEDDFADIKIRTAILSKKNMIALLCVKTADKGGAICRVDPREDRPSVQIYDDPEKALAWFTKSLRTSRANGWNVAYDGLPLYG